MIMGRPWPGLWVLAALFCGAGAILKVRNSVCAPHRCAWRRSRGPSLKTRLALVGAQVPACHPSVGDFITQDPQLTIWLPDVSTLNPSGATFAADCPGDVPFGFTVFVPSNDAVPTTLKGGHYLPFAHDAAPARGTALGHPACSRLPPRTFRAMRNFSCSGGCERWRLEHQLV